MALSGHRFGWCRGSAGVPCGGPGGKCRELYGFRGAFCVNCGAFSKFRGTFPCRVPVGFRSFPPVAVAEASAERDSGGENGGHGGVGERKISGFIARIHKMDGTSRPFPSASPCFGLPVREAYCALCPILPLSRSTRRLSGPMLKRRSMMERLGTKPLRRANTWK